MNEISEGVDSMDQCVLAPTTTTTKTTKTTTTTTTTTTTIKTTTTSTKPPFVKRNIAFERQSYGSFPENKIPWDKTEYDDIKISMTVNVKGQNGIILNQGDSSGKFALGGIDKNRQYDQKALAFDKVFVRSRKL